MLRKILFSITASLTVVAVLGQCGGTVLTVNNPSFEGTPAAHVTPPGWDICMPGVTPDTQPGFWGQSLAPSNGSSYLGLVHAPSMGWQEGAGQTLSSPMIAGTLYNFTIDLAVPASADPATGILVPPHCVQLQCWGGMSGINSGCDQSQLLWTSPSVTNTTWQTYNLSFTPTSNWDHILFVIWTIPPPCTDGQYLFVDNMTPIVPQADIADFSATTVCAGTSTQFTDGSTSPSGTFTNWTWDFGDGSPAGSSQNPTHLFATPGTYNVTLTVISDVPCTTSVTEQVVVNPIPVTTATASPSAVCSGVPSTLTAAGADTYDWSNGLGSGNPVNAFPSGTTTYTVTGTSLGCTSTATVTVQTGLLDISGSMTQAVSCNGGNNGAAAVTINSGTSPYVYSWSPTGGSGASASSLQAGTYTVTVVDSIGCEDTVDIIVTEPLALIPQITDSTHVLCYGTSTGSITVSVNGGTPPYSYLWMPSGGTGSTESGIPAGTYQVTITDDHGCTATQQFTVQQQPGVNLAVSPVNETCPGSCDGSASVLATGGTQPYSYNWNTVPPQPTQSVSGLCAGNYTVFVTDGNNCVFSESVDVETNSSLVADFSAFPPEGVIPLNVQFSFTGTGASTYLWTFGDGTTSTLSDPTHSYNVAGDYTVTLIVTTGAPDYCSDTLVMTVHAIQPSSLIMPNVFTPNGDGFNDDFKAEAVSIETMHVVIYNRWGKIVYEWEDVNGAWNGDHKSGGLCSDGTYYFLLEAKGFDGVEYNLQGSVTLLR